ncbi:MAG: hypothetical protein WC881_01275 [Elusimicrobiota bacterium]|jgi:hypothetical protein
MKPLLLCLSLAGLNTSLYANDNLSDFGFSVNTFSTQPHAQLLVTDSQGRQTGIKSDGARVEEIPGSGYSSDEGPDPLEGPGYGIKIAKFDLVPVPLGVGNYQIAVVGFADTSYELSLDAHDSNGTVSRLTGRHASLKGYILGGTSQQYGIQFDPAPGGVKSVSRIVTFTTLRDSIKSAAKLGQLGDDRFAASLTHMIGLAEKLVRMCGRQHKPAGCMPAVAVLEMFVKRLELANRKCDRPADCDEERDWQAFHAKHGKDAGLRGFFESWDQDEWHRWKKTCQRFVSDEALAVLKADAQTLIDQQRPERPREHEDHGRKGKR